MAKSSEKSESPSWSDKRILDETAARQFGYSFLRRAFIESPNAELISALKEEELLDAIPYQSVNESIAQGIKAIKEELEAESFSDERVLEFGDDYIQMFVGPGKLPCPPWEAVYRSEKRRVFQKETVEVRRAYEAYKLQPEKFKREPDDHIALELHFMGYLCDRFADYVNDGKLTFAKKVTNSQVEFLDWHLLQWVAPFCTDIRTHAQTGFYRGMADILEGFLVQDREYVGSMADAIQAKIKADKDAKKASGQKDTVKAGAKKG